MMCKLRPGKSFAQGHTAGKWMSEVLNPVRSILEIEHLTPIFTFYESEHKTEMKMLPAYQRPSPTLTWVSL